jgi:hypothetical protein
MASWGVEMEFPIWKIDKLRQGLSDYQALKGRNKPLSYRRVAQEIFDSPAIYREDSPSGSSSDFNLEDDDKEIKGEALRKFANRETILQDWKLQDLQKFLIYEGIFEESDFKDEPQELGEIMGVYRYLANDDRRLRDLMDRMPNIFIYSDSDGKQLVETIELFFYPESWGAAFRVEEKYSLRSYSESFDKDSKKVAPPEIRRGYAFRSTRFDSLHIFLRGGSAADKIHYVELRDQRCSLSDDKASMKLIRVGGLAFCKSPENASSYLDFKIGDGNGKAKCMDVHANYVSLVQKL